MVYELTLFQISYILERFYGGSSLRRIRLDFRNNFDLPLSAATIWRRVINTARVVDEAVEYLIKTERRSRTRLKSGFNPVFGDTWELDEIYIPIGSRNFPLIVVKDLKTAFIVAMLAKTATVETITEVLVRARDLARKCPKELRVDGYRAYGRAVKRAFRNRTKLTVNKKVGRMGQNQSIEGTFGAAIRSRIKGMRSLHSWEKSSIIIRGLILDYIFAKPCEALGGKTPAEAAMTWNPLGGKRGWPALVQLAKYYAKTRVASKGQNKVFKSIQRQITLDGLSLLENKQTRRDDLQLRLGLFMP